MIHGFRPVDLWSLASVLIVALATICYICLCFSRDANKRPTPVFPSWIVLFSTMALSFAVYWTAPVHSLTASAFHGISMISCGSILLVSMTQYRKAGKSVNLNHFQKASLIISLLILISWIILVWGFGGTGLVPFILYQTLMVIGYLLTAQRLMANMPSNEPFLFWFGIFLGSTIGAGVGLVKEDPLAMLNGLRSTLCAGGLCWLIVQKWVLSSPEFSEIAEMQSRTFKNG